MRKFFAFISATLLTYLIYPTSTFAAGTFNLCPSGGSPGSFKPFESLCSISFDNAGKVIANLMTFLLIIAIIIAVIFLIIGGIKWIVSGGDKSAVEGARNTIIAAIIGLIVALLAIFIVKVVLGLLGVTQTDQFVFPPLF